LGFSRRLDEAHPRSPTRAPLPISSPSTAGRAQNRSRLRREWAKGFGEPSMADCLFPRFQCCQCPNEDCGDLP
jgi:hypothetical protein